MNVANLEGMNALSVSRRKKYSDQEIAIIIEEFPITKTATLAKKLKRPVASVTWKARNLGLKKDSDYLRTTRIESAKQLTHKAKKFKKGHQAHNKLEGIGHIRLHVNNQDKRKYKFIKISDNKWIPLSRYLWEKHNGPIDESEVIRFKDGNPINCSFENLEKVTKADNAIRNSGTLNLCDNYIASLISKKGIRSDKQLKKQLLEIPKLIELKRNQIKLKRDVRETTNNQ